MTNYIFPICLIDDLFWGKIIFRKKIITVLLAGLLFFLGKIGGVNDVKFWNKDLNDLKRDVTDHGNLIRALKLKPDFIVMNSEKFTDIIESFRIW